MKKVLKIISIVLLFIFFGSLLVHSLNSINQDIGRHIKSGQIIWETGQVYKTNLFSFTEPNNPFINHHWLSEVAFYGLNNAIGLKGLILFKSVIILLALVFIFLATYSKTGFWPLAISSVVGYIVFIERTDVRPEIFSYLFLSFFVFAIFKAKNENNYRYLYFLPLAQILWTNMHIYFAIGPILLLFLLIDRYLHKKEELNKVAIILIATIITTLLNPNFIKGALAPLNILRHYGYSIVENQNIFFLRDYGISLTVISIFELSVVVLILSFVIAFKNGRRQITLEALSAIFFTVMAGKMMRNFGLYGMAFIPIVALNLRTVKIYKKKIFKLVSYSSFCILLIFLILNVTNNNVYSWLESSNRFGLLLPNGSENGVNFIKQNKINGPVFNNFDVGSFLIWKLYPEQKVFVDGRPEAYTVNFFDNIYKPMQTNPELWKKYSEEYKINYIFFDHKDITPWAQQFLSYISKDPKWPVIYLDSTTVVFIKKIPENKTVIEKFEIKNFPNSL